ncbi:MAG: fibronectin type III domain-containing protein [Candidatus Daviesbacteria bacterium]|nr:fibronectin type III domain-containing protein [Candidatus Daviesbacteria bacterium]
MSKILPLVILIVGLIVAVFLVGQKTGFFSRADVLTTPQEIKISNLSDNSFTVSYITAKPTIGFINFGETEKMGDTVNDDRDINGPKARLTHHITLKNLNPETQYFYQINTEKISQQTTAPTTTDTPPLADPIFGQIVKADKTIPSEAIIYSQIVDGTLLSSYSRDDGNFLITLNNARTNDLLNYLKIKDSDQIDLTVKDGEGATKKQVPASERTSTVNIILEPVVVKETISSWSQDYNNDGVVNVFDYAIFLKKQVSN